ncbi:MAG: hypothetical protein JSR77_01520 [Planctomycetes bacterium]|nr:hypothetical protein [Planctomycetota bacterium]
MVIVCGVAIMIVACMCSCARPTEWNRQLPNGFQIIKIDPFGCQIQPPRTAIQLPQLFTGIDIKEVAVIDNRFVLVRFCDLKVVAPNSPSTGLYKVVSSPTWKIGYIDTQSLKQGVAVDETQAISVIISATTNGKISPWKWMDPYYLPRADP